MENKQDFFIEHQSKTAGVAATEVLKLFGTHDNLFILSKKPEDLAKNDEAYQKVLAEILVIFEKNNVGITNYNFVFDGMKSVIDGLKSYMNNHVANLRKELDSRLVGAKNPLDGKYDIEYATHSQIADALLKIRGEQGNNPADYFTIVDKQPEPPTPSPY